MGIRPIKGSGEASSNHVSRSTSEPSKLSKRSQAIWASKEAIQLLSQLASQSANQLTNQQTNQPINRPTNQATNQTTYQPTDQPTNQPTNQLTSQPASQRTAEQTYLTTPKTKDYDPPCLAYFIIQEGRNPKSCFKFAKIRICTS